MRSLIVLFVVALATTACGSDGFPPSVARELGAQADAIALSLEAGDGCEAKVLTARLRSDADAAIARGDVPASLIAGLSQRIAALEEIRCALPTPTPTPTPTQTGRDRRHGGHDGKGKD